jgi:hypothetical protein
MGEFCPRGRSIRGRNLRMTKYSYVHPALRIISHQYCPRFDFLAERGLLCQKKCGLVY